MWDNNTNCPNVNFIQPHYDDEITEKHRCYHSIYLYLLLINPVLTVIMVDDSSFDFKVTSKKGCGKHLYCKKYCKVFVLPFLM